MYGTLKLVVSYIRIETDSQITTSSKSKVQHIESFSHKRNDVKCKSRPVRELNNIQELDNVELSRQSPYPESQGFGLWLTIKSKGHHHHPTTPNSRVYSKSQFFKLGDVK